MEETNSVNLTVKFSGRSIPISISANSTIKDLKFLLQSLTNVLPRGQKLIFKGTVLDDAKTVAQSALTSGAKIMLIASQGLHQGDGPILEDAKTRPISRANASNDKTVSPKAEVSIEKYHLDRWKHTGIIPLAESNLKLLPNEVWACGLSTRVLDVSNNHIQEIPTKISYLSSMQKLILNGNGLSDDSIQWKALCTLKHLTLLFLSQNLLSALPSELGALRSLRQLHVSNNKLNCLPVEIGLLTQLEVLKANNNRICTLPTSIGDCISLFEVDLSYNLLTDLPESLGNLRKLKTLQLGNNGLKSLPSTLFKMCLQLSTLDLHNTEITMDMLRRFEGWESFDDRRRLKLQKQLDFRVAGFDGFDEGADMF